MPAFSWNLIEDIRDQLQYAFMVHAYAAGIIVAIVAGIVGYFVVLRSLSFAAHALSHIGFAGATGAVVLGVSPVFGLLAWTLGLGVLFLSLYTGYATEAYALLFGQILGISQRDVLITLIAAVVTLAAVATLYRPLLFASVDEEVAEARGVPVRFLSIAFMVVLALAVSEAVQVVGILLIFALLVTPAAITEHLTARPGRAIALSVMFALAFALVGLFVSYYIPFPVSFFITTFAFLTYLAIRIYDWLGHRARLFHRTGP